MIAQSLLEAVAARAADTESQRRLPADLAAELAQASLFRMLVPQSLGGAEVDVATLFTSLEQLGRADAATGWCVMIGGTTALISAWLPMEHAREIWFDPNVITGGVFAPMGRAAVEGGDYLVSGRWAWGSGSANCSWLLGGAVIMDGGEMLRLPSGAPDHRMMVMRRAEVELIDTWDALGMRGTGSGDLAAKDVRVPQSRSVSFITDTPREAGPLYRFAPFGLLALGIAAVASGNALGALDDLKALAVAKKGQGSSRSLVERGVVQADFAVAQADLDAARALVHAEIATAWDRVVAGDALELRREVRRVAQRVLGHAAGLRVRAQARGGDLGAGRTLVRGARRDRSGEAAARRNRHGSSEPSVDVPPTTCEAG